MYVCHWANIKKWPDNIGLPGKNFRATPTVARDKITSYSNMLF